MKKIIITISVLIVLVIGAIVWAIVRVRTTEPSAMDTPDTTMQSGTTPTTYERDRVEIDPERYNQEKMEQYGYFKQAVAELERGRDERP